MHIFSYPDVSVYNLSHNYICLSSTDMFPRIVSTTRRVHVFNVSPNFSCLRATFDIRRGVCVHYFDFIAMSTHKCSIKNALAHTCSRFSYEDVSISVFLPYENHVWTWGAASTSSSCIANPNPNPNLNLTLVVSDLTLLYKPSSNPNTMSNYKSNPHPSSHRFVWRDMSFTLKMCHSPFVAAGGTRSRKKTYA